MWRIISILIFIVDIIIVIEIIQSNKDMEESAVDCSRSFSTGAWPDFVFSYWKEIKWWSATINKLAHILQ